MISPLWVTLAPFAQPLLSFLLSTLVNGKGDIKESMLAWTHVSVTAISCLLFPPSVGRILKTCGVPFWISRLNAQCGTVL